MNKKRLSFFLLIILLALQPLPYLTSRTLQEAIAEEADPTSTTTAAQSSSTNTAQSSTTTDQTSASSAQGTKQETVSEADPQPAQSNITKAETETEADSGNAVPANNTENTDQTEAFSAKIRRLSGGRFIKRGRWHYYRKKNGKLASNGLYKISGKIYYLDRSGRRRSGWRKIEGTKYYFGRPKQGYMYRQAWVSIGGKRYYFTKTGEMATGWQTIGTKQYFFKKNGSLCTTAKKVDGVRCRFNSKGEITSMGPSLRIISPCALIMEVKSGKIIYAKNPDLSHANASTTKIMTAILALENAKLTDTVRVSSYAASMEPTKLGMVAGDSFKLQDLLYSLLVASGNDTAVALAEHVSGTVSKFAAKMNKKAAELGCINTHFVTPSGLDAGLNHYTTARDLATIARHALKFKKIRQVISTPSYALTSSQGRCYTIETTNELLGSMPGVKGIKTGYTRKAGNCFVGLITGKNKKEYITVNLGAAESSQRWADARTLLTYAAKQE